MDREVVGGQETARAVAGDRSCIGRSWGTGAGQGSRRGQELDMEVVGDRQELARAVAGGRRWIGSSWGTGAGHRSRSGQELDREVVGDRSRPGQSQGTGVG